MQKLKDSGMNWQSWVAVILIALVAVADVAGAAEMARVNAPSGVMIRSGAGRGFSSLGRASAGNMVEVLATDGPEETIEGKQSRWWRVKFNGREGWCFGGFLERESTQGFAPLPVHKLPAEENELEQLERACVQAAIDQDHVKQELLIRQALRQPQAGTSPLVAHMIDTLVGQYWREEKFDQCKPWMEMLVKQYGSLVIDPSDDRTIAAWWTSKLAFLQSGAPRSWLHKDLNLLVKAVLGGIEKQDRKALLSLMRKTDPQFGWWRSECYPEKPEKLIDYLLKYHSGKIVLAPGQTLPLAPKADESEVMLNTRGWKQMPDGYANVQLWFKRAGGNQWEWSGLVLGEEITPPEASAPEKIH